MEEGISNVYLCGRNSYEERYLILQTESILEGLWWPDRGGRMEKEISDEGYVEGLRIILKKKKVCNWCPLSFIPIKFLSEVPQRFPCSRCRDFINLPKYHHCCPCTIVSDAPTRAKNALSEWDRGVHPWQKELRQVIYKEYGEVDLETGEVEYFDQDWVEGLGKEDIYDYEKGGKK